MSNTNARTKNSIPVVLASLALAIAMAFALCACNKDTSDSSQDQSADSTTEETQSLTIDTDNYSIELPDEWAQYCDVEYDTDGNAQVVFKDDPNIAFLTCNVNKRGVDAVEGDIGNGVVYSTDIDDATRLDVWAPNYTYLFWSASNDTEAAKAYEGLSDAQKEIIISLTSGKNISMSKIKKVKSEKKLVSKYGTNYKYLGKIVKKGCTVK